MVVNRFIIIGDLWTKVLPHWWR